MGERRTGYRALGLPAVIGALVFATGAPAAAEPLAIQIGRLGEVQAQEAGPPEPPRPGNVVGSTPVLPPRFLHLGSEVAGVFCKQFGLEFRAVNLSPGTAATVTVTLQHPLWTLPDGRTSTVETNVSGVSSDRWTYTGYTLEEPWAMVSGRWIFTISQGVRVLAVAGFDVTAQDGQREPEGGCTALTS